MTPAKKREEMTKPRRDKWDSERRLKKEKKKLEYTLYDLPI
jgi:hypothetical protein